ncbi:AMP-binding protein, partial [Candidatus Bathyarchaeota archaeon]|nr:AMP-binding protein [Candidatus Bathyarchaeota archaeon]
MNARDPPATAATDSTDAMTTSDLSQIWAWNARLPETITELTHTTISRRAALDPQKPAVESWDGILTYGAADSRSTRLALRLVSAGVQVGTLVPLLFEKSLWTVVGVLAIMKAGGTFILMDPSQPEPRLHTIVEEARAGFLLTSKTQEEVGARIAPGAERFVVDGETCGEGEASASASVSRQPSLGAVPNASETTASQPLEGNTTQVSADAPSKPAPEGRPRGRTVGFSSQTSTIPRSRPALRQRASFLHISESFDRFVHHVKHPRLRSMKSQNAIDPIDDPSLPPSPPLSDQGKPSLPEIPPSTPLYVIFTSGSTGKPKGVVISHANYSSGAVPRARAVGYVPTSRVFDFASYAFDVSIDCMLCTLSAGGTLCVPTDAARMNDLSGAIRASGANMAHMTPSVARVLDSDIIPALDVLGLGGESVSGSDAARWGKDTSVVICYGPSECTVGCTANNDVSVSTNIGFGVGGLTWIVDPEDHDKLVPIGSIGELLMEGPVVGVGYLHSPEKTAEVFIEDPAWLVAGHEAIPGRRGRMYKTGDLVRYDANGTGSIAFAGRKDQQVKLRGQRVELSEVEHHLRRHLDRFGQIVAEVVYPSGAEPTLVAFVSENKTAAHHGLEAAISELSAELDAALGDAEAALEKEVPRYMIPSVFVPLTVIPTLVSGKTNRKALKEMGQAMTRETMAGLKRRRKRVEKPETDMEIALHALWVMVLGGDVEFGLQDGFLALGGDSLRAMKLASVAREAGFVLTVATIFQCSTLKDMAAKLEMTDSAATEPTAPFSLIGDWEAEEAKKTAAEMCGVATDDVEDVYPCTPLQEALMA